MVPRFSNLTGPQIGERADAIVYELLAAGVCAAPGCEDGWLGDDSGSCPQWCETWSGFDMRPRDQLVGRRASPGFAAEVADAMRRERRQKYGMPRGARGRHMVRRFTEVAPEPYTMREPEPEVPSDQLLERARRAEEERRVQGLAQERAKAEKAARAKREGRA